LPAVVATHAEQHYGGKRARELGLGASLTLKDLRRSGIGQLVDVVGTVLATPDYRRRAQAFSQHLRSGNSAERAADAIEACRR
jgi:UDP:flavonoid glycosyltransferase YjiC (YdhE family)